MINPAQLFIKTNRTRGEKVPTVKRKCRHDIIQSVLRVDRSPDLGYNIVIPFLLIRECDKMSKSSSVKQIISPDEKENVCREILTLLPSLFENKFSIDEYAVNCRMLPVWAAYSGDELQGFISLRETSPYAAEIYVMGVKKEYQRHKVGKSLFTALLNYARRQGYEYLQVKTVKQGVYSEFDTANTFYQSLGFRELEVLPIWDENNPCQIYIRNVNF